jgi:hypothetical protein
MLKEKISLYPNLDKNIEFLNVLKTILNNENSKIKSCFLAYSTSQRFCVFFECEDFEPFSFDFYNYFFDYESSKYKVEKYIKYFSEEDINSLILLFENFTFKNHYEGQFFASQFFLNSTFNPLKLNQIYLKFTPNEKRSQFLIENKKVERDYFIIKKEDLLLKLKDIENLDSELIIFNSYGYNKYNTPKYALDKINTISNKTESNFLIVESFRDLENSEYYIGNFLDQNLNIIDRKSLI